MILNVLGPVFEGIIWIIGWTFPAEERKAIHDHARGHLTEE